MEKFLIAFLKELEALIVPPPNAHHAITFNRYGSDDTSWDDKLGLQVIDASRAKWATYFLEDDDFAKDPKELAHVVADMHHKREWT